MTDLEEMPAPLARGRYGAWLAVSLASQYWGIAEPQLRFFSPKGDGGAIYGLSRPYADPPELWVRSDLHYEQAYRTALHEVYHHAAARIDTGHPPNDASEELEAAYFATHFEELRRERRERQRRLNSTAF